ncbi:MAG: hypothetical protein LBG60_09240 [Bifidobacteriaceae bacterium]|jgi:hypothetical protein|nr:hypothetical protein [Bifidobacteriaceae bacterium]
MTAEPGCDGNTAAPIRQGDILRLGLPGPGAQSVGLADEPCLVAALSQTCDLVQGSKPYCLVAPAERSAEPEFRDVVKGRRPLMLPLVDDEGSQWLADINRAFSIKMQLAMAAPVVARCSANDHEDRAQRTRHRIARAFARFPFPDAAYPVFRRLQSEFRSKAGRDGSIGRVLELLQEVRVQADQWDPLAQRLTLYLIVDAELLIPDEEADPEWQWSRVEGWTANDQTRTMPLDSVCRLILRNCSADSDRTTLLHLWRLFGESLDKHLVRPNLNPAVVAVDIEVVSDAEFTLRQYRRTESLDLDALSDSGRLPG